jgi:3-methylfumaryl-CoA hydratase
MRMARRGAIAQHRAMTTPAIPTSPGAGLEHLRDWIGRRETHRDIAALQPVAALSATLDRNDAAPQAGDALPPLWHWLYFLPLAPASGIGEDGHPQRGGFLPPVPLPRRMWAGSRLTFHRALPLGAAIERTSSILDVATKTGRSGSLVFVTVQHEIADAQGVAITEAQDIVYRDAPQPGAPAPAPQAAPTDEHFAREIVPDPVLLFRYSALTFNGHRIHYDRPYATGVEGYAGLVVHGPMIATLLLDLVRRERPSHTVRSFTFKAVRPLLDIHRFTLCGRDDGEGRITLWARDHEGALAMQAMAQLS